MSERAGDFLSALEKGDTTKVLNFLDLEPALAATRTRDGVSAILLALYMQQPEIAEVMIGKIPALDLFEASAAGRVQRVAELLQESPESVNNFAPDGFTALGFACYFGHPEVVRVLLDRGADPNLPSNNSFGFAPIHSAAARQDIESVRLLLERGADPNAAAQSGATALHTAYSTGNVQLARLLLEAGASREARMDNGKTPADLAREKSHQEVLAL